MKKIFYCFVLFICLFFNAEVIGATEVSTAKCVYGMYTVTIEGDKLSVTHDLPSQAAGYVTINSKSLLVSNFKTSDGKLQCLNTIFQKVYASGRSVTYTLSPTTATGFTKIDLNNDESFVENVENNEKPENDEEILLKCSYGNGSIFITKTDKKLYVETAATDNPGVSINYDDIGDTCPAKIYQVCSDRGGSTQCGISLNSQGGMSVAVTLDSNVIDADELNGKHIKLENLYKELKNPMQSLSIDILSFEFQLSGKKTTLNSIEANDNICDLSTCRENTYTYAEKGLMNIKDYCNSVYATYEATNFKFEDCVSFEQFYQKIVEKGYITDLSQGCDLLSNDMREFLQWILDIVRIAGPMLAIILGSLDFIKVIFSGDADKEMKTAFNRFKTRLIAAGLLFLVPALLSLALNVLAPVEMDTENPFCSIK